MNIKRQVRGVCGVSGQRELIEDREYVSSGESAVLRSIRIIGNFVWLGLVSGALALPLAAEEVTVTIPPDDPPAQAAPQQPAPSPSLPSFSAGDSAQKPVADSSNPAAQPADGSASSAPAARSSTRQRRKQPPQRPLRLQMVRLPRLLTPPRPRLRLTVRQHPQPSPRLRRSVSMPQS